ncbi:TPA: hypothetical protein QEK88_000935 [Stenotrophomonas maltophilia]|nr:hypothetical protein [Stenotrophomonas maltophilia]
MTRDIAIAVISGTAVSALGWLGSQSLTLLPKSVEIPVWLAATILAGTGLAFWLLGLLVGSRRRPTQPLADISPSASADAEPTRSDDQIAVVQALRLYDDEYQPIESVQKSLARIGRPMPKSDVRVILQGLSLERWAESQMDTDTYENWYRLTGQGVHFAKEQGFPVSGQ